MKKKSYLLLYAVMVLTLLAVAGGCNNTAKETASAKRIVVDMAGRTVSVPVNPKKVATMQGPTYELLFMLGAKDKIGMVRSDHSTAYPLALLTNPDLKKYPAIVDLIKEMKYYYKTFYNYELSAAEAEKVLAGWVEGI